MSPIRLIILIGAAIAAIAAAFLVRNLAQAPSAPLQPAVVETVEVSQTKVLVARRDLEVGDYVTEDDMEWAEWPEQSVIEGYKTEADAPEAIQELAGSVVRIPMYEHEPILPGKLVQKGETGFLAALITPGMRAISVEISTESASGGFILPDDRVDVILTHQVMVVSDNDVDEQTVSNTIIQNVRVLAIDQIHRAFDEDTPALVGEVATLEVDHKEAELIAMAQRKGELTLTLRPWSDAGSSFTRDARTDMLENGGNSNGGIMIYRSGQASNAGPGGS